MTDQALDKLARRLMLDAARLEYGEALAERQEHAFSPAFERRMKKLLRRDRHPVLYRALRAAACLLLALLLSGCTVLAVSPEAREVFVGWVREIHDTYFLYKFFGAEEREPVSKEDVLYQPTYVPPGYRIEHRSVLAAGIVTIRYIDDQTGKLATFNYFLDTSSPVLKITWENEVIYKKVMVNGNSADLYLDSEEGEPNIIVWGDEKNKGAFKLFGVFSEEELIRMAESVGAFPQNVIFRPYWLPEGYYETSAEDCPVKGDKVPEGLDAGKSALTYENGKGGHLTITYAQEFDITALRPDRCEADAVSVLVGRDQAFLFLDQEGTHHLIWVDGASGVFFWVFGPFTEEELVQIAESMEKREEPPPLEEYQLTWTPYGYQEEERSQRENRGHVLYRDEKGHQITLAYRRGSETASLQISSTPGGALEARPVTVDGASADLYLEETQEAGNALVWARDGLLFWMIAPCSQEELIAMAESVEVLPVEYRLTWVPEGYELYMQNETFGNTNSFLYKDQEGRLLHFIVLLDREGARSYLYPNKNAVEKHVLVGRNPADLYLVDTGGANSELVWQDPKAGALFYISAFLPEEDILKMAESIEAAASSPKVRQPNWLPMGYRCTGGSAGSSSKERRYKNENGDEIQFVFLGPLEAEEREKLRETVKGLESRSVLVNGQAAELYSASDGIRYLVWKSQEAGELYWLAAALDTETLVQIAESVRLF